MAKTFCRTKPEHSYLRYFVQAPSFKQPQKNDLSPRREPPGPSGRCFDCALIVS